MTALENTKGMPPHAPCNKQNQLKNLLYYDYSFFLKSYKNKTRQHFKVLPRGVFFF